MTEGNILGQLSVEHLLEHPFTEFPILGNVPLASVALTRYLIGLKSLVAPLPEVAEFLPFTLLLGVPDFRDFSHPFGWKKAFNVIVGQLLLGPFPKGPVGVFLEELVGVSLPRLDDWGMPVGS